MRPAPFLALLTATSACTSLLGDFQNGSTVGADAGPDATSDGPVVAPDGGPPTDAAEEEAATITVTSVPIGGSVYFGQTATLNGSESTPTVAQDGQYSWTLAKVPPGSALSTSNLTGATTPTPSFKPDVLGEYDLLLKVSAFGQSQTNPTSVFAVMPQVFYAKGQVTDAGSSAFYAVADFDGGNAHPIVCPDTTVTSVPDEIATFASYAGRAYDFWEAPAGQPSRLAGFMMDYTAGTGYSTHLYATSADGGCGTGVIDFTASGFGPGKPYGSSPHFSPDGARFAVYDDHWDIVTYPADGSQSPINNVSTYPLQYGQAGLDPTGASGYGGYVEEPPRIEWVATTTVDGGTLWELAWAVPKMLGGNPGWAIVTAPDATSQTPTPYMTCPGIVPRQFSVLSDGSVLATYRQATTGAEDLVHLTVSGGQCVPAHNYTSLPNIPGAAATDFAVSPDGSTIAFLEVNPSTQDAGPWSQGSGQLPGGYVYTVPVVGGTLTQVSPSPALFGPRWIGAGAWLVFTRLDGVTDGGTPGSGGAVQGTVLVVPSNGGAIASIVAQGNGVSTFVSTSGSGACSASPGDRSGALATGSFFAVVASLLARRRRARSRRTRTEGRRTSGMMRR